MRRPLYRDHLDLDVHHRDRLSRHQGRPERHRRHQGHLRSRHRHHRDVERIHRHRLDDQRHRHLGGHRVHLGRQDVPDDQDDLDVSRASSPD
jgi:hypothetical protein